MTRPTYILSMAIVMLLLPCATYADDYQDCQSSCAAARDTDNANCPSPYDTSEQQRSQCMQNSQAAYQECVNQCPAPATPPPQAGEQQPPPSGMGY